jgi:hypothetical protein
MRNPFGIIARLLRNPDLERHLTELAAPGCIAFTECAHCETPFLCGRECMPATSDGSAAEADAAAGCSECAEHGSPPLPAGWCEQYHGATSQRLSTQRISRLGALA